MMDKTLFDEMIQTRRLLHTIPEEGWTEFHTTYIVVERLKDIGYTDIRTGKAIINPEAVMGRNPDVVKKGIERAESEGVPAEFIESIDEYTGCVAVLDTGRPGPVTAFRLTWTATRLKKPTIRNTFPISSGSAPRTRASCTPAAMTATRLWASRSPAGSCKIRTN